LTVTEQSLRHLATECGVVAQLIAVAAYWKHNSNFFVGNKSLDTLNSGEQITVGGNDHGPVVHIFNRITDQFEGYVYITLLLLMCCEEFLAQMASDLLLHKPATDGFHTYRSQRPNVALMS